MSERSIIPDLLVSLAESSVPGAVCTADGCRVVPPAGDAGSATAAAGEPDLVAKPAVSAAAEYAPDPERRFGGLDRLYGDGAHVALSHVHVVVAGIGGVGTWCAEALARSGVGALTLVDLDHIVESNINRQIHALDSTLGRAKVLAMADRVRDIHPACHVRCVDDFVDAGNVADILRPPESASQQADMTPPTAWANCVIDCTDQVAAKIALILQARALGWPLLVCGGAGGKTDPLALRTGDLSAAAHDALLARVRQDLRKRHGYPKGGTTGGKPRRRVPRMGVHCLWFDQPTILPAAWVAPQGLSCAGYGSIVTVTATMGMAAANWVIQMRLQRGGGA